MSTLDTPGLAHAGYVGRASSFLPLASGAFLVFAAYFLGAKLGLALTFRPHPISVLWPPNAILLAALLLAPIRWWPVLVAAAFPAHLLAELQDGVPAAMVLCWFVSNVTEALIGAFCVRWVLRGSLTFDSLRDVSVFIAFGALLAPFLSSFLDAAFVRLIGWGDSGYWQLWQIRFFSNILATLTIVPVIVTWATAGPASMSVQSPPRIAEGGLLLGGLLVVSVFVFDVQPAGAGVLPALLYLPLPFLLWAALRFGPAGSSAAFMVVALLVIWGAAHGRGPFVTSAPLENALAVQVFLTFVGVTLLALAATVQERRSAEQRLRSSEERYREVVESQSELVCRYLPDTTLTFVNGAYCRFFGQPPEQLIGHRFLEAMPESAREPALRHLARLAGEKQPVVYEHEVLLADGGICWQQWVDHAILGPDGRVVEFQGIGRDITDRKRAEEANERLAHVSRLAVMGELTASIAHEINQPLGAILSNADAAEILLKSDPVPMEELRQIIEDIRRDDMRASEVIKRVRSLLRKRELAFQPFDLNRAINDVVLLVRGDLDRRRITVTTDLAQVPIVQGDQVHVQQVVLNLILNGADAMAEIPESRRRLQIRTARSEAGGVEVIVSDTGPGIPPGQADRLFESFFTTKPTGMGLGLAIARSIVEAHEGRIWAETRPEGGASFRFTLTARAGATARRSAMKGPS